MQIGVLVGGLYISEGEGASGAARSASAFSGNNRDDVWRGSSAKRETGNTYRLGVKARAASKCRKKACHVDNVERKWASRLSAGGGRSGAHWEIAHHPVAMPLRCGVASLRGQLMLTKIINQQYK